MNNKKIVCIVLVAAVVLSWYMGISNMSSDSNGYEVHLVQGNKYAEENLFRKAVAEYESALTFEDNLELRLKISDTYIKAIENGELSSDGNLVSMLLETMTVYKNEPIAYETACNYFYKVTDYDELSNALQVAENYGVSSKELDKVKASVRYLFERGYSSYSDFIDLTNGYYIIKEPGNYSAIKEDMTTALSGCEFIAPYSFDEHTVAKKSGKVFIIDSQGIRQKYLDDNIIACSGIANGNIACKIGDKYSYFNTQAEKVSGDYFYAGRFSNGVAAVQKEEGKWILINKKFEQITKDVYEDIRLNTAEECVAGGIILAKANGKYNILNVSYNDDSPEDVSVKANTKFSCEGCYLPVDATTGSNKSMVWFAFKQNGKWGYADAEGSVKIKPQFNGAKSFSNGYAAVSDGQTWDFIDESGKVVMDLGLTNANYFNSNGYCFVKFADGFWNHMRMFFWQI
ncbi:MAG: WG repeat-containing protein [Clostridia bacterium]|nr:WG repeat-containing protein [Clostridia bacterium]